jgi:pseudaminic acid biosynthesis-associated methylase
MNFLTEQERFWAEDFGDEYFDRNKGERLVNSRVFMFGRALKSAPNTMSMVEFGCNRGLNLQALKRINENFDLCGYEINKAAASEASKLNIAEIHRDTVVQKLNFEKQYDLSFTKGLLIHINPNLLNTVYENLYNISKEYIFISEYYNPKPVSIEYRGHDKKLFKRDFAGELIDKFDMKLIDYGFIYHRDNHFPLDDNTWFLLKK